MSGQILSPEEYAKMHQKAFRCAFDFLNSHFPPGMEPEWWDQAAKDVSAASAAAGENKLVIELLAGVYEYLNSEYNLRGVDSGETDD